MKIQRLTMSSALIFLLAVEFLSFTVNGASLESGAKDVLVSNSASNEDDPSTYKNVEDRGFSTENDSGEFVVRNDRADDYLKKLKEFQDSEAVRAKEEADDGSSSEIQVGGSKEEEDEDDITDDGEPSAKFKKFISQEETDRLRLKRIKQQILDKLQLSHPPNITEKFVLPRPIVEDENEYYSDEHSMDIDDYYGKTTQIILFSEIDRIKCHPKSPDGCFHFHLSPETLSQANTIQSATMWLYKISDPNATPDRSIKISELSNRHSTATKNINVKQTFSKDGWVTFDVKHLLRKWQINEHPDHSFIARCENCPEFPDDESPIATDGEHRPFMVIDTTERRSRIKRDVDCIDDMTTCCRKSFYVSFEDINWHDWIINPKGFYANYCDGSCAGNTLPRYHHTSVMQRVSMTRENQLLREELTPCCTPTKMSNLSLLYYTNDGNIVKKNLPNMKVESCSCS